MQKFHVLVFIISSLFFSCGEGQKQKVEVKKIETIDLNGATVKIYTTAKDTDLRLTQTQKTKFEFAEQPREDQNSIFVNPNHKFQNFIGIGGAITDASAQVFAKLSPEKQEELLNAYFGPSGNNYSIIRTSIHSSDFGTESFTYIDEGDTELKTFSIAHDRTYRLPMIKRAIANAGGDMLFYMSPWSPPAFMKDTKNMLQGGKLLPEFYDSWAMYFAKTIKAYEAEGIPVWGVTIQNEPMAVQRWESCIYTAEEERDFLKNHLGPTLEQEGLGDKNIVVWDHNRDLLAHRSNTIFDDPEAAKYAWGTGFHWYENWRGGTPNFQALAKVKEAFPDKQLLFTEGCNEGFKTEKLQYWPNAERYGTSMIHDFNNGTAGWTDWNILLDETGGPNHVNNLCFSPIHADTTSGELIYTPSYYFIGHFSKFIKPGAKRISTTSSISFLESTSFQNEDGSFSTVVLNKTESELSYKLYIGVDSAISITIPPRAIQTIVY
ncbi:MAG: glycosyl hydrolase [Bacteroidetes bacterium MedPE-SWsnd-G2]|nr:MAG: glycosyl hydrolase [Bacteroidetes bacterium MedPE-SWsnd-G2]